MSRRKAVSHDFKVMSRPPERMPFAFLTLELMQSPAWRSLSLNAGRLVEFLMIEHMSHGGKENGNLLAPYNQLETFGIGRRLISHAIREAEAKGLIDVKRGGRRGTVYLPENRFRLTFYLSKDRSTAGIATVWLAPTDDWRKYKPPALPEATFAPATLSRGSRPPTKPNEKKRGAPKI